jgi:hypothetical protein
MFGSEILDVAIGLSLTFVLLSLICTAVTEAVEQGSKQRAKLLNDAISELLGTGGLAQRLYEHPLVFGLFEAGYHKRGAKLPSYIPPRTFALAVFDLAVNMDADARADNPHSFLSMTESRDRIKDHRSRVAVCTGLQPDEQRKTVNFYDAVITAIDASQYNSEQAVTNLENWYNAAMDRVSGRYKRVALRRVWIAATLVTLLLNVNTIVIGKYLYIDGAARDLLVARAEALARAGAPATTSLETLTAELEELGIPMGWQDPRLFSVTSWRGWIWWLGMSIVGWLVTIFAISLGAPFWFDTMNKFMVIRSTVKPREKSGDEGSEDRSLSKAGVQTPPTIYITTPSPTGAVSAAAAGAKNVTSAADGDTFEE